MTVPGLNFTTGTSGADLSLATLSSKLRVAAQPMMKFQQFCNVKEAFGKGRHDELIYDKISNILTAGTALTEINTMPASFYSILPGTLTITEYGNSVPWTGKVEALSKLSVRDSVMITLRNDQAKALDQAAKDQFVAGGTGAFTYTVRGTASGLFSSTGVAAGNNTSLGNLTAYHVREIVKNMKIKQIPKYDGQDYICIASPSIIAGLHSDAAAGGWQDAYKYTKPENMWSGEAGRLFGVRFVEETNLLSNVLGGTSGASGTYGEAVFFGDDAVAYGVAIPPEIRYQEFPDFGRHKALAWYGILGFHRTWDNTLDSEARIVHVTCGTGT